MTETNISAEIEANDTDEGRSGKLIVASKVDDSETARPSVDDAKQVKMGRGTGLGSVVNGDNRSVEVISATPADELAARPMGRPQEDLSSNKYTCNGIRVEEEKIAGDVPSLTIAPKGPSIVRRPSDRLRDKIAGSSASIVIEDVQSGEAETLPGQQSTTTCSMASHGGTGGGTGASISSRTNTSGKVAQSSSSSVASPGAYAVPGPGREERGNRVHDENEVEEGIVQIQEGENPIDAFVADDPVTAIAFGEDTEKEHGNKSDGKKHKRKALLAVFGMMIVIFVVGMVFGTLVSNPNNEEADAIEADQLVCKTQMFWTPPSFPEEPAEVMSGNIDVDSQNFDVDGATLLVAAKTRRDDISKIAHVYNKLKGKWTLGATITYDGFIEPGYPIIDVAICGDYLFVGHSGDDSYGIRSGSVLVYKRNEMSEWIYNSVLYATNGSEEDMFGSNLSCDGINLIVGAVHRHDRNVMQSTHEDNADLEDRSHDGSAYIFSLTEETGWSQVAKFIPTNGNFQQQFGYSVGISRDVAAVGSDKHNVGVEVGGSVHVYVEQGGEWGLAAVLLPSDLREGDHFGISIDVDAKGNIIAGAKHRSVEAAYIFRREGKTQWVEEARLEASDGSLEISFGHSVGLHSSAKGDLALVGAFKDSENRIGAAYAYQRANDGTWNATAKLSPSDLINDSFFGSSVAIKGDNELAEIIVGAGSLGRIDSFELC